MRVLVCSLGTLGDALPFLALAEALERRGHDVTLLGNGYYSDFVAKVGLQQINLVSRRTFAKHLAQASLWADADRFVVRNIPMILPMLCQRVFHMIVRHADPGNTVIVAHDYLFGARVAQEVHGFRTATVHLQPTWMRSLSDPPLLSPRTPRWLARIFDRMFDDSLDKRLCPHVNRFRFSFGLAPVSRLTKTWWNSPDLTLAMFPEWLGPPQPDWPANTVITGFPFFEASSSAPDMAEATQFLQSGDPPLVFTQSSVTKDAEQFYSTAIGICKASGRRGILLTSHEDQIPRLLPESVRHFRFLPMRWLLPKCALHVNHGGMGSVAWTLAAGIPHLNVPWGLDQRDTSLRLKRLGVAEFLPPSKFTVGRASDAVRRLLTRPNVASACRDYAQRCRQSDALEIACQAIESLDPLAKGMHSAKPTLART